MTTRDEQGDPCVSTWDDGAFIYVRSAGSDGLDAAGNIRYRAEVLVVGVDFSSHFMLSPAGCRELAAMLIAEADDFDRAAAETAKLRAQHLATKAAKAAARKRK